MISEKKQSVEETLSRLEEIVSSLDKDELTLEESLTLFEEGVKLADTLKKRLEESELRVKQVLGSSDGFKVTDFEN